MSMGIREDYGSEMYGERWMAQQALKKAEKAGDLEETKRAAKTGKARGEEKAERPGETPGRAWAPRDEYINSEKSGREIKGLYQRGKGEDGSPGILYRDPKKAEETCTGNTDRVDREISKLKERVKQLEQQIRAAGGDERKVRELEEKLTRAMEELGRKDNDTYRRQNMDITNG